MQPHTLPRAISTANVLASLVSAGYAVAGMVKPAALLSGEEAASPGTHVYANVYGARQIPLVAVTLALLARDERAALAPVLTVAGLAQAGDSVIGVRQRNKSMAIGAGLAAGLHLASAWWYRNHPRG